MASVIGLRTWGIRQASAAQTSATISRRARRSTSRTFGRPAQILVVARVQQGAHQHDRRIGASVGERADLGRVDAIVETADVEQPQPRQLGEPLRRRIGLEPLDRVDPVGHDGGWARGAHPLQRALGHGADRSPGRGDPFERALVSRPPAAVGLGSTPIVPREVGDRAGPGEITETGNHGMRTDDRGAVEPGELRRLAQPALVGRDEAVDGARRGRIPSAQPQRLVQPCAPAVRKRGVAARRADDARASPGRCGPGRRPPGRARAGGWAARRRAGPRASSARAPEHRSSSYRRRRRRRPEGRLHPLAPKRSR